MRLRLLALTSAVAFFGGACTTAPPGEPGPTSPTPAPAVTLVKIAYFEDLSPEGADEWTAPAFQGARLAIDTAGLADPLPVAVELMAFDTKGSSEGAATVASEVAADPAYVAAIGAPFLTGQAAIGRILDPAGVPMITLSTLGPKLAGEDWTTWRRAVANEREQGGALAAYVDGQAAAHRGVCLLGDASPASTELVGAVADALTSPVALRGKLPPEEGAATAVMTRVAATGCGVVVWGGRSDEGAPLRRDLVETGLRGVAFVGGDGIKDETFLSVAGGSGVGTVATCPCADLSASTALPAQRFIQDYQADFGLPPGPYAVEALDVARMILRTIRDGATTRGAVLVALAASGPFEGLANTYAFRPDGELTPESALVRLYRDEGGRWIPLPGP